MSVRPVILLSSKSAGDRFEKIKPIAYLLAGMIEDIKECLDTFIYVFTKFSEGDQ